MGHFDSMETHLISPVERRPGNEQGLICSAAILAVALLLFAVVSAARAQDSANGTDADSAAIKQTFSDFYESFSHHDARATAMTFADDADFTNMRGIHRHGRGEIEAWFANLFRGNLKSSNRTDIVRSIRFFSPEIDVERVGLGVEWRKGLQVMFRLSGAERPCAEYAPISETSQVSPVASQSG